jgi:hypothetical protein
MTCNFGRNHEKKPKSLKLGENPEFFRDLRAISSVSFFRDLRDLSSVSFFRDLLSVYFFVYKLSSVKNSGSL